MARWLPYALAALALAYAWQTGVQRGRAEAAYASARLEIDSLRRLRVRVDTQYAGEKLVYAGWRERWDTVRVAHLQRLVDSLTAAGVARPETVQVSVPVSVLVTADSTVRACAIVVATCEERVRLRDAELAAKDRLIAALPRPRPLWLDLLYAGGVGYVGYRIGARP